MAPGSRSFRCVTGGQRLEYFGFRGLIALPSLDPSTQVFEPRIAVQRRFQFRLFQMLQGQLRGRTTRSGNFPRTQLRRYPKAIVLAFETVPRIEIGVQL